MGENMENQDINEESYNGSYKATQKNDSSHQWKATCKILLQSFSPTQFHKTFVYVFLNHKMLQIIIIIFFCFKFWFWGWLPKVSFQPNSSKLLFMCSWITKCSKSSSYVFILWDHILSSGESALSHSHLSLSKVLVYFGGWGGGELSTFQESLATHYSSPPPHSPPNQTLSGTCFACLLAHNSAVHELANEPSH